MSYVAECDRCGVIKRGDLEQVGDAVEDHEQFHDVQVKRVVADGGAAIPTVRFADDHVEQILAGEKTVTVRFGFEYDLDPGMRIRLVDECGEEFATATVATQCELRADWISYADFSGHRRYKTTGELVEQLGEYYEPDLIGPETTLDVLVFQVDQRIATDGGQCADGPEQRECAIDGCTKPRHGKMRFCTPHSVDSAAGRPFRDLETDNDREVVTDGGVPALLLRVTQLADARGAVPEDGSGIDGVWTDEIPDVDLDHDWFIAINADDEEREYRVREGREMTIKPYRAHCWWDTGLIAPAAIVSPAGGQQLRAPEEIDRRVEDQLIASIEAVLEELDFEFDDTGGGR